MKSLPTLFYDKQELLLDIDIYGKIVSTPQTSREDLAKLLFEEFKFTHPVPTMEDERYKLSNLVSTDYKIQYDNSLELHDNETLVDLQQKGDEQPTTDIFKIEVPKELQELFSYGKPVDEDYKMSLMEKFALLDDEDNFERGITTTEKLYGSVKEDSSSVLSDDEIDNIGKESEQDEEYDMSFEDEEDDISDDEISDDYLEDDTSSEEDEETSEYSDDEDEEEYDLSSEDEDDLSDEEEDFSFSDDEFDSSESNITTNEEESEQTSEEVNEDSEYADIEYEEDFDEEYDDYSADDDEEDSDDEEYDDTSYEDDSEDDEDYSSEDSENYEEDDMSDDYEDEDDISDDYEDEEDLSADDNLEAEADIEDFDDLSSDEDEEEDDFNMEFEEPESEPEPPKPIKPPEPVVQEEVKPKPKPAPLTENKMFGVEDDIDLNQFGGVEEPDKPKMPEPKSSEFGDNEPKELRAFLKKHPRCEMSVVLKYFSKKEVEPQIRLGKVIKRGNTLRI